MNYDTKMILLVLVLFGVVFLLIFLSPANAQTQFETINYCNPDNTTLIHVRQVRMDVAEISITRTINVTEPEHCYFGCDPERNACNYPTWVFIVIIIGALVAIYFGFKLVIIPMTQSRGLI